MMFDENKLISLKENFTGQKFQWVKTDRPELLGKLVKCRDVQPNHLGGFNVIFDDGSKVDSTKLNSNLMMIHGEVQPLSRAEVEQIAGPKLRTQPTDRPQTQPQAPVQPSYQVPHAQPQVHAQAPQPQAPVQAAKPNMFAMFNSEETQMMLSLKVKLPDKKLLKMMYSSAEDKEKFLAELSEYLHSLINKQVIAESMRESLDPVPVKKKEAKPAAPQIEVREL